MSIKTALLGVASKIKFHSPTILLVTGVAAIVGGTVAACVATTKLETIVDDAKEKFDVIKDKTDAEVITCEESKKLKTQCYLQTAGRVAYLYSLPTVLVAGGITCVLVSHHILSKRAAGLTIALNSMTALNNRLRRNIVAKYGQKEYNDLANPEKRFDISPEQKEADEKTDALVKAERNMPWASEYDRCFDESNPNWQKCKEVNENFLGCHQSYINDKMMSRRSEKLMKNGVLRVYPGYILASEVDEILGWNRPEDCKAGSTQVGKMTDGACDPNQPDYFDLGIFEKDATGAMRLVVDDRNIWLHPNYDGVVADKIGRPIYFKDGVRCDKNGVPI